MEEKVQFTSEPPEAPRAEVERVEKVEIPLGDSVTVENLEQPLVPHRGERSSNIKRHKAWP
eukprot:9490496-Pyramimonas_sp.AAC.1